MTKRITLAASLALAGWASLAAAQSSSQFSLELGYQFLDLSGNEDTYKSQVNEDEGFVLRDLSFTATDSSEGRIYDRLRVSASDLGASPFGRFRLEASREGAYRLGLSYHHAEHYQALAALANPFLTAGIVPGQHTLDRSSDTIDVDLELLPGRTVTPLLGYRWHRYQGPARTTYQAGGDEFLLASDLEDTSHELHAGVAINVGGFAATLLQGWRWFDQTDRVTLAPGAGGGNGTRPVLGRDVTLTDLSRTTEVDGTVPITTAHVTGRLSDRVRLVGSFVRAELESDVREDESLAGSLVSFELRRFFAGLTETTIARADGPDWRGEARVEAELSSHLDIAASFVRRHRERDGNAIIDALYTGTTNFSGADPRSIAELVEVANAVERDEEVLEAVLSARDLGPIGLWVSAAQATEDVTIDPDAVEIVVPGGQGGSFEREVKRYGAGASVSGYGIKASLDWRRDDADQTVVRTDYLDRDRLRGRLSWSLGDWLRVSGSAERMDAENPTPGVGYDLTVRQWSADLELVPAKGFSLRGSVGAFESDSEVTYRRPHDFSLDQSIYAEDGELWEVGAGYAGGRFAFDLAHSVLDNDGSLGFDLTRTWARLSFDVSPEVGASLLYDEREYEETDLALADFDARRWGVFLRWHRQ